MASRHDQGLYRDATEASRFMTGIRMHGSRQGDGYLPHIDGLRALAVLSVIVYHLDAAWLPGGFTGVDIFFAISGFVVSASVDRLPRVGAGAELLRFYARRLRRIAPALIVCLLATALASMLFIPVSWLSETSEKTGRMAFFGLSNWVLAATGNDYFSPRTDFNPYTHTWSLGVEEQFYLLFPLLFLVWSRCRRGWGLALFGLATLASMGHAWWQARVPGNEIAAFYLTTTRFWQLGLGVLLYQLLAMRSRRDGSAWFDTGVPLPRVVRSGLMALAMASVAFGLWHARPGHSPWIDGLWPVLGTLGLIALLHRHQRGLGRVLTMPVVVLVGRWSYSLYLWHWPVLVVLRWTVGLESAGSKLFGLLLTFGLAAASYRWVETPWRHGRLQDWRHGRIVVAGIAALALAAALQAALVAATPYLSLSTVSRHPLDWYAYARGMRKQFPHCRQVSQNREIEGVLVRKFMRGKCTLPPGTGRQLFVVGDSHAVAYNELLRRYAVLDGGPVHLYAVGGCAVAGLQGGANAGCEASVRASLADVQALARPGDVLLLPGLRVPRIAEQDRVLDVQANLDRVNSAEAARARQRDVAATVALLRPLDEGGVRVVFEAPKPVLPAPPYRCSDWFNRGNAICAGGLSTDRQQMEAYRRPALDALQAIVAALPHASLWDPLPLLCERQRCSALRDGRPLFFDADHLSGYGNRFLLPPLREHLDRLPPPTQ